MQREPRSYGRYIEEWRARLGGAGNLALALGILVLAVFFGMGCTPQVGDSCQLSTDCGATGNLVCDTSQFEGYCTLLDCVATECPNNAACVLFNPTEPGCGYDDRLQGSPVSQQMCMATCSSNSDCRVGYVCAAPGMAPWFATVLDNKSYELTCLPLPPSGVIGGDSGVFSTDSAGLVDPDAPVCQLVGPTWDAYPPPPDASGN